MLEFIQKKGMTVCTCCEVVNKKAVGVPRQMESLEGFGERNLYFMVHSYGLKVLAGKILNLTIN